MNTGFILLALLASASAASICDTYAVALNLTQVDLVTYVVAQTVNRVAVVPNTPTQQYFNGSFPAGSYNFLANATAVGVLEASLVAFFGAALGCSDPTYPAYTGANMTYVHRNMAINEVDFDYFNNELLAVMAGAGVSSTDLTSVKAVLDSTRSQIVTRASTICVTYASILNMTQADLVTYIVVQTFGLITASGSNNRPFFDGSMPSYTDAGIDYINNSTALGFLAGRLVQFFGQQGVLGCNDPNFPAYQGPNITYVHRNMGITDAEFEFFNAQVIAVAAGAGVTASDQTAISNVLESTRNSIVTFRATSSPLTTMAAQNSNAMFTAVNFFVLAAAALIAALMF